MLSQQSFALKQRLSGLGGFPGLVGLNMAVTERKFANYIDQIVERGYHSVRRLRAFPLIDNT